MKKIDIRPYPVMGMNEKGEMAEEPFPVKRNLWQVLAITPFKDDKLFVAEKVKAKLMVADEELFLEGDEYATLRHAMDHIQETAGFLPAAAGMVMRVRDATDIEAVPAPKGAGASEEGEGAPPIRRRKE